MVETGALKQITLLYNYTQHYCSASALKLWIISIIESFTSASFVDTSCA